MSQMIQICLTELRRLRNQVRLVIGRGRSTTPVNDAGVVRTVQANLGYNQIKDNTPVVQQYGFASNFPANTDLLTAYISGDRSNGVIIGTNNQTYSIKNLGDGSVCMYDMFGNTVLLNKNGITATDFTGNSITMSSAGIKINSPVAVEIDAPNIRIHATQVLKYDADGNGTTFTSNTRTDYVIGSTGSSQNLHPPETP